MDSPLHTALRDVLKNINLTLTLIEKGADVNKKSNNRYETTPLHFAIVYGNADIVSLLINEVADVQAKNKGFEDAYIL